MLLLVQFQECLARVNVFLKLIGLSIDSDDSNRNMLQCFRKHWICFIHLFSLDISVTCEIIWLVQGIITGKSLWEITYLLPCLTLCILGNIKVCCFVHYIKHVNELVDVLTNMQKDVTVYGNDKLEEIKKWPLFLSTVTRSLLILIILGVTAFALGPIVITASIYYSTGEFKLFLPFLIWYPFDEFDLRVWPFVYLHQMWSAWVAVFSLYGPHYFFFTCCTFIQIQFLILQQDLEQIGKEDGRKDKRVFTTDSFKPRFVQLVDRHRELIRCVGLLEIIYSKAILFNVVTSSLVICAAGFNLMAIENLALMAPFTAFLFYGLLQIFFYCYYGDYVMRSSLGVSDAVYNSHWYEIGAAEKKYLLIVLIGSQKPCKLTAYGFADVNLRAFTRILSTSWSYFALLKQMDHN